MADTLDDIAEDLEADVLNAIPEGAVAYEFGPGAPPRPPLSRERWVVVDDPEEQALIDAMQAEAIAEMDRHCRMLEEGFMRFFTDNPALDEGAVEKGEVLAYNPDQPRDELGRWAHLTVNSGPGDVDHVCGGRPGLRKGGRLSVVVLDEDGDEDWIKGTAGRMSHLTGCDVQKRNPYRDRLGRSTLAPTTVEITSQGPPDEPRRKPNETVFRQMRKRESNLKAIPTINVKAGDRQNQVE